MDKISDIKNSVLFHDFADNEARSILKCLNAAHKNYTKGEAVFLVGDTISVVGLVLRGELRLQRDDINGNFVITEEIMAGETFGTALVCAGISQMPVSVWSVRETEIIFLDYARIINMCTSSCSFHAKLIRNMLKDIGGRLIKLNQKLDIVQKKTLREKLMAYFEICGGGVKKFSVPFNKTRLAEYIGVNRSAMSREISKMCRENILEFQGDDVVIQ